MYMYIHLVTDARICIYREREPPRLSKLHEGVVERRPRVGEYIYTQIYIDVRIHIYRESRLTFMSCMKALLFEDLGSAMAPYICICICKLI